MKIEFPFLECKDIKLIHIDFYPDCRGSFNKLYDEDFIEKFKINQINISQNKKKGTVRGLHYQNGKYNEQKLVYCLKGEIIDYLIDLRVDSKTFGKVFEININDESKKMILVPYGFAHGFQTIKDNTNLLYLHDNIYNKKYDLGINILDTKLNINFMIDKKIISEKDQNLPIFNKLEKYFEMQIL
jgi:dTDP-4-dehydrorhamnose 3,5-epimerase